MPLEKNPKVLNYRIYSQSTQQCMVNVMGFAHAVGHIGWTHWDTRTMKIPLLKFKRKTNAETIWIFQGFTISKKNSCSGNYMRKYGIHNQSSTLCDFSRNYIRSIWFVSKNRFMYYLLLLFQLWIYYLCWEYPWDTHRS